MVEPDDLRGLFQPYCFDDSMIMNFISIGYLRTLFWIHEKKLEADVGQRV